MRPPNDDLLSAFHDGEVTAAERAVVEQRLATSAEARRELSENKQLSSLLKASPRERLPAEFPQQVLQSIEREMLIPSRLADTAGSSAPRHRSRSWIGVAAVLTSAAGLLLLVRVLDDNGHGLPERHLAGRPNLQSNSAPGENSPEPSLPLAMSDSTALGRKDDGAAGAAGENSVSADLLNNAPAGTRFSGSGGNRFYAQSALGAAEIGEVVRVIQETDDNEVAVVLLTVVDRRDGIDGLQLLLAKNRIEPEGGIAAADKKDRSATSSVNMDQIQAVLVQSNAAQLESALKQLRQEKYLQSLEVDQPILLAQLDEVRNVFSGDVVPEGLRRESTKSQSEASSATRSSKSKPVTTAEQKRAAALPAAAGAAPDRAAPAGPVTKLTESRDGRELLAKQVPMGIPTQVLQQNQLAQQNRARSFSKGASRSQTQTATEKDSEAQTAQRQLQVLFVVVDQEQAAKQHQSPNPSPKPSSSPAKARSQPSKAGEQDGAA